MPNCYAGAIVSDEQEPARGRRSTLRLADAIAKDLSEYGLILRGGFLAGPKDEVLFAGVSTVLLIGNAGPAMWEAFALHIDEERNPLDRWTRRVIDPIADRFGARAVYPFGPDVPPFQRWALRADTVHASPLGILIHSEYGLWHAYRAALLFIERLDRPGGQPDVPRWNLRLHTR